MKRIIKIYCIFSLILFNNALYCQITEVLPFQTTYKFDGDQKIIDIIELDSSLIILGSTNNNSIGSIELLKTTKSGDILFTKNISNSNYTINPFQILQTNSNEFFLIAEHKYTAYNRSVLYKLDSNLNSKKMFFYGTDSTYQTINFIAQKGNYYYLTGTYSDISMSFGNDFWVIKIEDNGTIVWDKHFGTDSTNEVASSLQIINDKIYVFGDKNKPDFKYSPYYITLDTNGNFLKDTPLDWEYNGGVKMSCKTENNIYVVGESSTSTSSWFDIYLDKLDINGDRIWRKLIPGTEKSEAGFDIKCQDNYLFVTGYAHNNTLNNTDLHLSVIDTNGLLLTQKLYNIGNIDIGYKLITTRSGGIYLGGFGKDSISQNYFLIYDTTSYIQNYTGIKSNYEYPPEVIIYPNPTNEKQYLILNNRLDFNQINVYNMKGEKIFSKKNNISEKIELEFSEKGIFIVEINTNYKTYFRKIIRY